MGELSNVAAVDELRERVAKACRVLGISYHTLQAYLRYSRRDADTGSQLPAWVRSASAAQDVQAASTVHERREES